MLLHFLARRVAYALTFFVALSAVSFIIIQLPPGDYVTTLVSNLELTGRMLDQSEIDQLVRRYGADRPLWQQYFVWLSRFVRLDFGRSFYWNQPVIQLIATRLPYSLLITVVAFLLSYAIAIPIGIYSAVNQYSIGDYLFTIIGFIGIATPSFLIAIVILHLLFVNFGLSLTGLFSPEYTDAPWSWAKFLDLLKHLPLPILISAFAGAAWIIRVMRNCLLDELRKQYVVTARAKGVPEKTMLFRYPVRIAINPIISTIGWVLPTLISGETVLGVALGIPTLGPLLYRALLFQDMYLAASVVMILGVLVILGTLVSDLLLVQFDPRIRLQ